MSEADKYYPGYWKRDGGLMYCGYIGNACNEGHIWFRGFLIAPGGVHPWRPFGGGVWALFKLAVRHQI